MKQIRLLLWLFLCSFGNVIQAQTSRSDYRPFVEEGKTWETQVGPIDENLFTNRIEGDTIIAGTSYKKVYNSIWGRGINSYSLALREDGSKVYAVAKGSTKARLLYDFGLEEGSLVRCGVESTAFCCLLEDGEKPDTLLGFPFVYYLRVERTDMVESNGQQFRRIVLTLLDAFREPMRLGEEAAVSNVIWVEGVGSALGPFTPWIPTSKNNMILSGCKDNNNNYIFSHKSFFEAGDAIGVNGISYNPTNVENSFDLQGRRLTEGPAKGVYIQNGKKAVIR